MLISISGLLFHLQEHKTKSTSGGARCHQVVPWGSKQMPPQLGFDVHSILPRLFNWRGKVTFTRPGMQLFGLRWVEDVVDVLSPFLSYLQLATARGSLMPTQSKTISNRLTAGHQAFAPTSPYEQIHFRHQCLPLCHIHTHSGISQLEKKTPCGTRVLA